MDNDIKICFICKKNNRVLLNNDTNIVPTIYIKESFYSIENIRYYLSMYLNTDIDTITDLGNHYFVFSLDKSLSDYSFKEIDLVNDNNLIKIINSI